jgi:DNA-binding NarL/FixJ family response regulator
VFGLGVGLATPETREVVEDPAPPSRGRIAALGELRELRLDFLAPRERELDLVVRGLSNPENCESLVITAATAKTDVARILQKVGLRGRVQVLIYAYESGLLSPGEPELRPQARRRRRTR